jgi:hypothetical protein
MAGWNEASTGNVRAGHFPSPCSPADLIRRLVRILDLAQCAIQTLVDSPRPESSAHATAVGVLLREKIVSEAAMLLLCVEPLHGLDARIHHRADALVRLLIPHARDQDVRAAICLDPGLARDHAVAHVILSRLGFPDPGFDELLAKSLDLGPDFGPERLPHRRLEQTWLARLWPILRAPRRHDTSLASESPLGHPMDVLGATRLDIYAFTHAVMYATDLGGRAMPRVRKRAAVADDAEACLAFSLDTNDFDLTAELLMTWPMLGLPSSAVASFAFSVLAGVEDELGFLPGLAFDRERYERTPDAERVRFALSTCYHTVFVMGFLCAALLRSPAAGSAAAGGVRRRRGAASAMAALITRETPLSCWRGPFESLGPRQQDAVSPLLFAIAVRRARSDGNLAVIRRALESAVDHNLIRGPAVSQAAALLRRSVALPR